MKFIFSPSFVVCLYVICIFTPLIYTFYLSIPFTIALFFLFITFRKFLSTSEPLIISLFALLLLGWIYRAIGYSTASIGNYLAVFFANLIYAIWMRILYPDLNPLHRTSEEMVSVYGQLNMGSTEFTYCAMLIALFFFIYLFKLKDAPQILPRFLLLSLFVLSSFYLFVYGLSATATLTLVIAIIALLFFEQKHRWHSVALLLGLTCIIIAISLAPKDVIDFATDITNEKTGSRVAAIIHSFSGNADLDEESMLARITMIDYNLKTWFEDSQSLTVGWGYHTYFVSDVMENMLKNKCGNHSAIFDVLPRYGLLGFSLLILIILYFKKYIKKTYNSLPKEIGLVIFFVVIISNMFNRIMYANILFILSFVFPYVVNIQNKSIKQRRINK